MSLNSLLYILFVIVLVYCALALYLYLMQPRLLYYPDLPGRELAATPADIGLEYEPVTLVTEDGVRLGAWFIPRSGARGTLLFLHGNAGNISHRLDSIRLFHELGLAILILDYRGYGESEGTPSEAGTYQDADAAWRYLVEQRRSAPRDIVVFGRSLGAIIAAELAARTRPGALIMESAFTSVPDMAATLYPWLPVRLLSRYHYDALKPLARTRCPLLIAHSRADEIIPFTHGQRLFEHAREPKQFLELRGGHNDGFLETGQDYIDGLERFLSEHLDSDAADTRRRSD
ncbi:MAG: alpha/beta hydrolase [Gammaproteobacteria bacterium]|nr:alpha/beta hydrolase [Gammaproteobacteria bacterium]MDH3560937.1 alpha/beta hydrolase [Gammaproteobacteria bacterium]